MTVKVKPEEDEEALVEGLEVDVAVVVGVGVEDDVAKHLEIGSKQTFSPPGITCIPMIA